MTGTHAVEKVSYEIMAADNGCAPICNVTVESPRVADIDPHSEAVSDALETLAWSIDPMTVRRARTELAARMSGNPLCGWGSLRFAGHA